MIRTSLLSLAICLLLATSLVAQEKKAAPPKQDSKVVPASHEADVAWFDLEHCPICKCMSSQKGLMESMKWETHVIDNGMISVSTIPADKKEAMAKCKKEMTAVLDKLKSGEKMELCGFCNSYGALVELGAKAQEIDTENGMISLLTSDKPEVVKKIQEHAKTTIKEYAALLAAEKKTTDSKR